MMTVGDLKRELEDYDDDVEVRLGEQPSYPFAYSIDGLKSSFEIGPDPDEEPSKDEEEEEILYILEGVQIQYLTDRYWD